MYILRKSSDLNKLFGKYFTNFKKINHINMLISVTGVQGMSWLCEDCSLLRRKSGYFYTTEGLCQRMLQENKACPLHPKTDVI